MNRDALLASLIGFGIGLLITGALLVGPNLIKGFPHITLPKIAFLQKNSASPTPTPSPTPAPVSFTITSPVADAIVTSSDLLVSGTAPTAAIVIVAGPLDEDVMVVKDDGKYAGKISLTEGKNDVTVTSFINGKGTMQTVTIFYTKGNL